MAEEMKMESGSTAWKSLNTLLGIGGLATALGVGIPALVKSDDDKHHYHGECSDNTCVNRFELNQSQRISELESAKETDAKLLEVYKAASASDQRQDEKFATLTKSLTDYVIANNREVDGIKCDARVNQQEIRDNLRFLDYKIDNNQKEMYAYVDCHTLPLERKIGINQICPTPLPACVPVAVQSQVIASEPTTVTNTPVGSRNK